MLATTQNEFSTLRQKAGLTIAQIADELQLSEKTIYRYESGETTPRITDMRVLMGFACAQTSSPIKAPENAFTFIDLFAGIGGLRKGFEHIGGQCVFTSEWDKYSQQTYRANFHDDHEIAGDITKIEAKDIPAHDVLVAGFPCQPFSIAGVSKKNSLNRPHGFACDTQGTLFFDVARIIDHHKPAAFILENVKNLVSHDKGKTFKTICNVLKNELGYHIDYRVINAKSWVPQNRARIFIVGFRKNVGFDFNDMKIPDPLKGPKLSSILLRKGSNELSEKYTLSDKLWTYLQNYAAKHKAKGNGFGFGLVGPNDVARTLSARYYKDGSEILVAQKNSNPRRLTPRECARLMGFDEGDQEEFKIPVSDTQSYRQFGNSVAVPAVKAVAEFLEPFIKQLITQLNSKRN